MQLHFSATARRTQRVARTLTASTAIFVPLTLITGVFGMSFEHMPLLKDDDGFWVTMFGYDGAGSGDAGVFGHQSGIERAAVPPAAPGQALVCGRRNRAPIRPY